ncbi:cytochrome c oxidase assembly factor 8-like [Ruditapes philippinarum]|uniref:cytochrome c oxidase assembly factor 8-like n=1 Tax=Ruditapes philippinarum TaxID=129788 RepID=UPI00295A9570|nr:cytochrome c oxidase assembly factor 8-like [Ruditapes philippinarum]
MAAPISRLNCQKCFSLQNQTFLRCLINSGSGKNFSQNPSKSAVPLPQERENDWVGPPDKISNIRPVEFYIPEGETSTEKKYREKRQAVQEWHHEFWTEHNKGFFTEKEEFIQRRLAEKVQTENDESIKSLTPEELSEFYKRFLDDNFKSHIKYNKEWYKKNISLLWPALHVYVIRMMKLRKKGKSR